jgi:hypothetical protein
MFDRRKFLSYAGVAGLGVLAGAGLPHPAPFKLEHFGYEYNAQATKAFEQRDRWKASDFDGDIVGVGKNKVIRLWKLWERAAGCTFEPHLQEMGDCVGQALALGLETQSGVRTISDKTHDWVGKVSTELLYIAARIEVGRGAMGWRDGTPGVWAVEAAERFGVLPRADYGKGIDVSKYNPELARRLSGCWLGRPGEGVPKWLEPIMVQNPLRRAIRIDGGFDQAADFVASGYPILLCSQIGYVKKTDDQGFLLRSRVPWRHAMLLWGVDTLSKRQGGCIANSWDKDWYEVRAYHKHSTPDGCFWCDRDNIDLMLASNDCFAIVEFSGPIKRKLIT